MQNIVCVAVWRNILFPTTRFASVDIPGLSFTVTESCSKYKIGFRRQKIVCAAVWRNISFPNTKFASVDIPGISFIVTESWCLAPPQIRGEAQSSRWNDSEVRSRAYQGSYQEHRLYRNWRYMWRKIMLKIHVKKNHVAINTKCQTSRPIKTARSRSNSSLSLILHFKKLSGAVDETFCLKYSEEYSNCMSCNKLPQNVRRWEWTYVVRKSDS